MKKHTQQLKSIWVFLGFLLVPVSALAAPDDNKVSLKLPNAALAPLKDNAYLTFTNIFNFILSLAFSMAVLSLIANGIRYIVAFGNEDQIEKAKNGVFYSVLGLAILILAYTIAATINYIFAPQ